MYICDRVTGGESEESCSNRLLTAQHLRVYFTLLQVAIAIFSADVRSYVYKRFRLVFAVLLH